MASIPKITIDQQLASIGVEVTPAKIHISTPRPVMHISTELPEMSIERKAATFKINRKKINTESGLKPPDEIAKDISLAGKTAAMDFTNTTARDGEFLSDVTKRGNRIAQLARSKNIEKAVKTEVNIASIPKSTPEVIWDPGYMRINWSNHSVVIEWDGDYMPEMTVDPPYSVEVFLRNKPYFRITVEEGPDPYKAGSHVDRVL